ncbi:hypothetical protein TNCV_1884931 [Trichonephila clavipes]|nr:hypothetical protein TNCV_1884931 [Trichonephila clavipes]
MHRSPQWYWVRTHNMPATIRCLDHQATTATRSLLKEVENDHACEEIAEIMYINYDSESLRKAMDMKPASSSSCASASSSDARELDE